MVVLYIIGAGCSRNYDGCTSPVPDLRPPLDKDFFKMAKKIIDFYGLSHMYGPVIGLDHFTRNLNRMYGYGDSESDTTVYDDDRLSLESVMTHFYLKYELLDRIQSNSHKPRIDTLNELLAHTITESLKGPMCSKHVHLAKRMQKGDVIWNFNYDLLVDNAIRLLGKFTDSGYVTRFDYTLVNGNWEKFQDNPSDVIMLKLHGSLNWLRCAICGCNLLLRFKKYVPELWTHIRELPLECPKCGSSKYTGLERIIIPPSLVKSFGETEVRYLWKFASSLNNIHSLVVVGFRFAEQDPEVEMLLRTMVQYRNISSDVPIHIVNPRPKKVSERFKLIFNRSEITHESPDSFFEKLSR